MRSNAAEFRLAPEYRRCGLYVTLGILIVAAFAVVLNRAGLLARGPGLLAQRLAAYFLAAAAGLLPFWWRLHVDRRGIWRRRLIGWDLWSWRAFANSSLKNGVFDRSLVDPARPWWRRTLSLGYLTESDQQTIWRWIEIVRQPPNTQPLPTEITIRFGFFTKASFDDAGLHFGRRRLRSYAWNDVLSLEVSRLRHDRDDFRSFTLKLPDRTVRLHVNSQHGLAISSWKGPDAEELARFLMAKVPAERQTICASLDPPRTAREAEWRATKAYKHLRDARLLRLITWTVITVSVAWFLIAREPTALVLAGLLAVCYAPVAQFLYRRAKNDYEVVLRWQADLASDKPTTSLSEVNQRAEAIA